MSKKRTKRLVSDLLSYSGQEKWRKSFALSGVLQVASDMFFGHTVLKKENS